MVHTIRVDIDEVVVTTAVVKLRANFARTNNVDTIEVKCRRSTLAALKTVAVGHLIEFWRNLPGAAIGLTLLFDGYVTEIIPEEPYITIKAVSKLISYKRSTITQTWTSTHYHDIAYAIDAALWDIYIVGASMDGTATSFVLDKETKYDGLVKLADATNTEFKYYPVYIESGGATWLNCIVFEPVTSAGGTVHLYAGAGSGNNIIGRPKWRTDDSEIVNYVTVLYQGGSVTQHDDDSITAYGQREITLMRKDINNSTDAQNLADKIIAAYHEPRKLCDCKIKQGLYYDAVTTTEELPFYYINHVIDAMNSENVDNMNCEKITVQWPENYDVVTYGPRRTFTRSYLRNMETRLYNIEKSIDQDVLTTSSPTFSAITIHDTDGVDYLYPALEKEQVSYQNRSERYRTRYTLVSDFETLADWDTASGQTDDTTNFKEGSRGIKFTSIDAAVSRGEHTIGLDAYTIPQHFEMWVYIDDLTKLNYIRLRFEVTPSWTKYFTRTIASTYDAIKTGWNKISFNRAMFASSGGAVNADWATITIIRLDVVSNADVTVNVTFDDFRMIEDRFDGKVTLRFDDDLLTAYTEARERMDEYGFGGVAAIRTPSANLTVAQLTHMQERGWDIISHTVTHPAFDGLTDTEAAYELKASQQWLIENGFVKGSRFFAAPNDAWKVHWEQIKTYYLASQAYWAAGSYDTIPPADGCPMTTGKDVTSATGLAIVTDLIDAAKTYHAWLTLRFHEISDMTALFQDIIDYIYAEGIEVVTFSDVFDDYIINVDEDMIVDTLTCDTITCDDIHTHDADISGTIIVDENVVATGGQFIGKNTATDTLRHSHDAETTTTSSNWTKLKTTTLSAGLGAGYRVNFDIKTSNGAGGAYGKIYKNGVALGSEQLTVSTTYVTKTEDLTTSFGLGDTMELYCHATGGLTCSVQNFRVYYDADFTAPSANS